MSLLTAKSYGLQTSSASDFCKTVLDSPLSSVLPKNRLIWIGSSATIAQALRIMMENGVAALPVYDNATNEPLGIADVRLIASYLVWTKFRVGDGVETAPDPSVDFAKQLVASLLPSSSRPLVCLKASETVSVAVAHMINRRHQVIVQMPLPYNAQRLLSRTDVVRWLSVCHSIFPTFGRSLAQLGVCAAARKVVFMYDDESALDGLRRISDCGLGALPVLARESGVIVATLSCSVVRYVDLARLQDVQLPVLAFLQRYHPPSLQPVLAKPSEALIEAVRRMLSKGVHRAWVADEAHRPVACLSLSDVLRIVLRASVEPANDLAAVQRSRRASAVASMS